jgi:hypothetical protein
MGIEIMTNENPSHTLAVWYAAQCDGSWEHSHGITIETLDNPGWSVKVDLADTALRDMTFITVEHQLENSTSWWRCWKEETVFCRVCGAFDLPAVIEVFVAWTKSANPLDEARSKPDAFPPLVAVSRLRKRREQWTSLALSSCSVVEVKLDQWMDKASHVSSALFAA